MSADILFRIFNWLWIGLTFLYLASHNVEALARYKERFGAARMYFLGGATFYALMILFCR